MRPMLATPTEHLPVGDAWVHEVKWDGVRILLESGPDGARLFSRNGNVVTPAWPDVALAYERDVLLDGEIIALNERGVPDFRVLQHRMHVRKATEVARLVESIPVVFMCFDLLRLDGRDLTDRPLDERRETLESLDLGPWQVPGAYDDGAMLFDATLAQGLEGVVSKRRSSRYRFDQRSKDWLKRAHRHRGSYVIGGWRPQTDTTDRLASLLVGEPTTAGLLYRGRVGSGIAGAKARTLQELLTPLTVDASPFADEVPSADAAGTFWTEPLVVVDLDTHGLGYDRLRQPSYQGIRSDLTPEDLLGEEAP
ncbi:MAG: non-homologous end-joining DNA ligase [Nocardioides sp.]|jgi:bifunctional non-homologous end joining protein LigD